MHDLTTWCESWAQARGYWAPDEAPGEPALWWVRPFEGGLLRVCLRDVGGWTLTPLQFWLFALAVDTGRTDSQRCPDCEGSKVKAVKRTNPGPRCTMDAATDPAQVVALSVDEDGVTTRTISRPCPTCTGPAVECEACEGKGGWQRASSWDGCRACDSMRTVPGEPLGFVSRPLARVVCESMGSAWPKMPPSWQDAIAWLHAECSSAWAGPPMSVRRRVGEIYKKHPGLMERRRDRLNPYEYRLAQADTAARCALGFHLDALQAEGDPLGQALALRLHGVPCETCKGKGKIVIPWSNNKAWAADQPVANDRRPCACCHGEGTALAAFVHEQLKLEAARPLVLSDAAKQQLACATTA